MNYWLIKSEPDDYSFQRLVEEHTTRWDSIRNYQARNFLRQMEIGDLILFYHSKKELAVVGIAEAVSAPYPDPTEETLKWSAIDIAAKQALTHSVSLKTIKANPLFSDFLLVKNSRLSVMPVPPNLFQEILSMSQKK